MITKQILEIVYSMLQENVYINTDESTRSLKNIKHLEFKSEAIKSKPQPHAT